MSYSIPNNIDVSLLFETIGRKLRSFQNIQLEYANGDDNSPTAIIFIPDLSIQEQDYLAKIISYVSSLNDFENLPNYATWTPQEGYDNTFNAIFNGANQTTVDAQIDALPNTVAGMKTGLKALAAEIITIRLILAIIIKMIAYLRNLVVKLR